MTMPALPDHGFPAPATAEKAFRRIRKAGPAIRMDRNRLQKRLCGNAKEPFPQYRKGFSATQESLFDMTEKVQAKHDKA